MSSYQKFPIFSIKFLVWVASRVFSKICRKNKFDAKKLGIYW